ncbi:MAG TPA: hypothetical protein P5065_08230 [Candidatus Ratteibacteria bacterium]|nr:hypothetical protein [bacterium]HRS07005.1 hypothetical protein [Candidatus Ratteibacteria bacterium]HON06109.1 hypothetical protein [bacterium]HPC29760.1 hypothetical protein [bacterium]HQL64688.1 hypothetical protein [bacterium]
MSVIQNLIQLLKTMEKQQNAKRIISVEISIHPFSCLDEDNLNFLFGCVSGDDPVFTNAKIKVKRDNGLKDREYIVENVEIEVDED